MSFGIQAGEQWWNEVEFSMQRWQFELGKIKQAKLIVRAVPNATLKELFVQMESYVGCKDTCDVKTVKENQFKNCSIVEHPSFRLSKIVRGEWTTWLKLWQNLGRHREPKLDVSYCSTLKHVYMRKQKR